jgi:hypothetical protein
MGKPASQTSRKQHYVPEMYLSGFENSKKQCFVVDASEAKTFTPPAKGIAAQRDFNLIEAPGVPPDALEAELGKFESVIAPAIKRVRQSGNFGEDGEDREDVINLITLLAVRNPRSRADMTRIYTNLFQAMVVLPFEKKERWEEWVGQMKAAGKWPAAKPADFEGHKKYVEENKDTLKPHQNFTLEQELNVLPEIYPYFDARRWRILKAKDGTGGFVTTDHPVCVHRPLDGINYGQQYAPGLGLADRDILLSLSPKVALIGRLEGAEDVMEVGRHNVASFNATIIGFAMKQIYATDDQFYYTRSAHFPIGRGFTLLNDPNFKVRER